MSREEGEAGEEEKKKKEWEEEEEEETGGQVGGGEKEDEEDEEDDGGGGNTGKDEKVDIGREELLSGVILKPFVLVSPRFLLTEAVVHVGPCTSETEKPACCSTTPADVTVVSLKVSEEFSKLPAGQAVVAPLLPDYVSLPLFLGPISQIRGLFLDPLPCPTRGPIMEELQGLRHLPLCNKPAPHQVCSIFFAPPQPPQRSIHAGSAPGRRPNTPVETLHRKQAFPPR